MDWVRNLLRDITDERFRTAVVLGIASIPFTIGINWLLAPDPVSVTADGFEATALFTACMLSGYLYKSRRVRNAHAGVVTGLVGGVSIVVWGVGATLVGSWRHFAVIHSIDDPRILAVVSVGVALLTAVVALLLVLFLGYIGGVVGGWVSERIDSVGLPTPET